MPVIQHNGKTIAYRDEGAGPPVVLLHGAGLTHRLWDPQIEQLRSSYRCIAIDLRGHGGSYADGPSSAYTTTDHAGDVVDVLDALDIPAAHLVGLSLGGMVGAEVAVRSPSRALSLTTIGAPDVIGRGALERFVLRASTRYLYRRLASTGMDWVARTGARRMTKDPVVRAYMIEDCAGNDPGEFTRVWEGVLAYDGRSRLPSMRAPAMLVVGSKDPNRRGVLAAAGLIPGARIEIVEGAGHILNRERAAEVGALLEAWLKEQEAARGNTSRGD